MSIELIFGKRTARILLFAGAAVSIAWAVYFSVVTILMPYQIEFREGTALVLTRILLNGENPFVFGNQPLAMTNYGVGYNLAVLPFATSGFDSVLGIGLADAISARLAGQGLFPVRSTAVVRRSLQGRQASPLDVGAAVGADLVLEGRLRYPRRGAAPSCGPARRTDLKAHCQPAAARL